MYNIEVYQKYSHLKPYDTIEKALSKRKGRIMIKNPNNFTMIFYLIIDIYLTIKILKTIRGHYHEIINRYSIRYVNNLLWSDNTFEMVADEKKLTIEVVTGNKSYALSENDNVKNLKIDEYAFSLFLPLLENVKSEFQEIEIFNLTDFLERIAKDV